MSKRAFCRGSAVATAVLLVAGAAHAGTRTGDSILLHSNQRLSGRKITSATVQAVKHSRFFGGGDETETASELIKEITWDDAPGSFRQAASAFGHQRYDQAIEHLKKCPAKGPRTWWYEPYKALLHGQCLLRLGQHAEAAARFGVVVEKHSRSFYFLEALEGKAEAHLALKQYQEAADTFARLDPRDNYAKAGEPEPYGKLWQIRGQYRRALALIHAGKPAGAARIYQGLAAVGKALLADPPKELRGAAKEITTIRQSALVGRAEVLMSQGKYAEAKTHIEANQSAITDSRARLKLYMALGELAAEAAKKLRAEPVAQKAKYKEAILNYMRVYILYPEQKDLRPKAMYGAATAFEAIGTPIAKGHAIRLYRQVVAEAPKTEYGTAARQRLERYGVKVKAP